MTKLDVASEIYSQLNKVVSKKYPKGCNYGEFSLSSRAIANGAVIGAQFNSEEIDGLSESLRILDVNKPKLKKVGRFHPLLSIDPEMNNIIVPILFAYDKGYWSQIVASNDEYGLDIDDYIGALTSIDTEKHS